MYKVLENERISIECYKMIIEAEDIARSYIPGQFIMIMAFEDSEKIPLTVFDYDKEKNLITIVYQVVGASTLELTTVTKNIFSVVGPLGNPSDLCLNYKDYKDKKVCFVAGGVGIASIYPQIKYLYDKGIKVDIIYGARNVKALLFRKELESMVNKIYYATDNGSFGTKGFVTDVLKKHFSYDIVVAIGPIIMMKSVCDITKRKKIKTIVSMNPIMVDGSGMCGSCRCMVKGVRKFACIDGPEFDGAEIDFEQALQRINIYQKEEDLKLKQMKKYLLEGDR